MKKLEEGQIVRCTVDKIAGTIVFVKIDDYNQEGTITFSEISPGRIRNIRDYVVPKKKIVCKVLKIDNRGTHLSLRRVKPKERKELSEAYKKEKSFLALLKTTIKDSAEKVVEKIKQSEESIADFLENVKDETKHLEKYIEKGAAEKISKILKEKKEKEIVLDRKFILTSKNPDGIKTIKKVINEATSGCDSCDVSYLAAGKYRIKIKTKDPKKTEKQLDETIDKFGDLAKENDCKFDTVK
jgi:translation initiation factor 2 alpha subunit (eIF-2alpha)